MAGGGSRRWPRPPRRPAWISSSPPTTTPAPPIGLGRHTTADGLEVIAGEEVTTRHGHWLAIGLPPGGWVDWRYAPRDGVFAGYAARVRADGGLVVAAHPSVPLPGCAWEFGYHDVDAMEVWNGLWNVDDELSLRIWHQLLRQGGRITAVGGSDSHVSDSTGRAAADRRVRARNCRLRASSTACGAVAAM